MAVANTEPPLLDAEVGVERQLHDVARGVERQPVGRHAAELDVGVARVDDGPVVDAAQGFLQLKVQEGELEDEPSRGPQGPPARLRLRVVLRVARRGDPALGLRQNQVTAHLGAAQHYVRGGNKERLLRSIEVREPEDRRPGGHQETRR